MWPVAADGDALRSFAPRSVASDLPFAAPAAIHVPPVNVR
jgi:hypothetical protein